MSCIPLIVRRKKLPEVVGVSGSSADRLEASGDFPKRRRFSEGIVGWYGPELEEWAAKKARG